MIVHANDGSDLVAPATVLLKEEVSGFSARAAGAEYATITVYVEDENGALDFVPFTTWRVRETTATAGNRVFWAGFIWEQRINRGDDPTYPVGAGRRWELDLVECNQFVQRRLLRPDDGAKRPAESVDARMAWLLTTVGFTGGLIVDHGLIETSAVTMDAFDYTGATGKDVLDGAAVACGFTPHIRYREVSDDYELIFLDYLGSGLDLSTLKISNVKADVDNATIFAPSAMATLHRSPERRASGIGVQYDGGFSYQQDAGTQAEIGDVDLIAPAGDVNTKATADALGLRLLAQQAEDEERVDNLTIRVPAASVNIVKQGQLVVAKFSHFLSSVRDWTNYVYCRVLSRTVRRPQNLTQGFYDLDLELVPTGVTQQAAVNALLRGPNDNNLPGSHSGTFVVNWDGTGDTTSPPSGCALSPLSGAFSYVGVTDEWTGIEVGGYGTLTAYSHGEVAGATAAASYTLVARILKNGAEIANNTITNSDGGARAIAWTWDITTPVDVVPGDMISVDFTIGGIGGGDPFVIPAGVGNCAHMLHLTGSLLVAP